MIELQYPLKGVGTAPGIYITQRFGQNLINYAPLLGHPGVDFSCITGTEVYAAHDGYMNIAENPGGYGHYIYLTSTDGIFNTIYGHLQNAVGVQRNVKTGDLIAYSNNSGNSTNPHLHFGLQPIPINMNNGYAGCIDPMPYLKGNYVLIFFQVKGNPTLWSLIDGQWTGFSDPVAFTNYVNSRTYQVLELDQVEFNKVQINKEVFKT